MSKKMKIVIPIIMVLFLSLLLIILMILLTETKQKKYAYEMQLGDKYLAMEEYESAEICYRNALDIQNKKADAYVQLHTLYEEQGNTKAAENIIQEAKVNKVALAAQGEDAGQSTAASGNRKTGRSTSTSQNQGSQTGTQSAQYSNGSNDDFQVADNGATTIEEDSNAEGDVIQDTGEENVSNNTEDAITQGTGEENVSNHADTGTAQDTGDEEITNSANEEESTGTKAPSADQEILDEISLALGIPFMEKQYCKRTASEMADDGILAYQMADFDEDDGDEIFVIALKKGKINLYVLEKTAAAWVMAAQYTPADTDSDIQAFTVCRDENAPCTLDFYYDSADNCITMRYNLEKGKVNDDALFSSETYYYGNRMITKDGLGIWTEDSANIEKYKKQALSGERILRIMQFGLSGTDYDGSVCYELIYESKAEQEKRQTEKSIHLSACDMEENSFLKELQEAEGIADLEKESDAEFSLTRYMFHTDKEESWMGYNLAVEISFRDGKCVGVYYYVEDVSEQFSSYKEQYEKCDEFLVNCFRLTMTEPDINPYEGTVYSWKMKKKTVEYTVRPGIIQYRITDKE